MKITRPSILRISIVILVLSLVLVVIQMGCVDVERQVQSGSLPAEISETGTILYFPIIDNSSGPPPFEVAGAETRNSDSLAQNIFFLWDTIEYATSGVNNLNEAVNANLSWTLAGPCDSGVIFNDTISLPPGPWEHTYRATTPGCNGAFTATAVIDYLGRNQHPDHHLCGQPGTGFRSLFAAHRQPDADLVECQPVYRLEHVPGRHSFPLHAGELDTLLGAVGLPAGLGLHPDLGWAAGTLFRFLLPLQQQLAYSLLAGGG